MALYVPTLQRINGATLADADSINWLMQDFVQENELNYGMQRVHTGARVVTYRSRTYNNRTGPGAMYQHTWAMPLNHVIDETLYQQLHRILLRPVTKTMTTRVQDWEFFSGDGTTREFYLWRQALGAGYSQSASTGLGVNSGNPVELRVYNAGDGTSYAVVNGRTYTMLDFAGAVGDTVTITVGGTATVLTGVAGAPGANQWQSSVSNDNSAENLRVAIDALAGVTATRSTNVVTVIKDAATLTLTLASSDPSDIEVHPTTGEVAIDIAGTYAYKNLQFNAAPASTPIGNVRVEYQSLYRVEAAQNAWQFTSAHNAQSFISSGIGFVEVGG